MTEVIRMLVADDQSSAEALLDEALGGRDQARLGELVDVLALGGFGAWSDDTLVGVTTWSTETSSSASGVGEPHPVRAELVALAVGVDHRGRGTGGRLTEAVCAAAAEAGCHTIWLLTTNDSLDALRLYQRHGFRIVEVLPGGVDQARLLKPGIPAVGGYGIPLHDELIMERHLA